MESKAFTNHIFKVLEILAFMFCISGIPFSYSYYTGFYDFSCPSAEYIVRDTVRSATSNDATVPGKLLRLLFHDCFVEGCDASVLIEGSETEKDDPANASLGGFEVIESAKTEIEFYCPGIVSCADIVAMAARDAVAQAGGPNIQIPMGRLDGRVSRISNVRPNLIDTSFTLNDMMKTFGSKGLSMEDIVVLSVFDREYIELYATSIIISESFSFEDISESVSVAGAHTIGLAHCNAFNERFRISSNGNLTFVDPTLNEAYALNLAKKCLRTASATVTIDPQTPLYFDNQYYNNLMAHKGLFQSDSNLFANRQTRNLVEQFASDLNMFYEKWSQSFIKLSSVGVKTNGEGEIRQTCSRINGR